MKTLLLATLLLASALLFAAPSVGFAVAAVGSSITGSIGSVTTVNSSTYDVPVTITSGSGESRLKIID